MSRELDFESYGMLAVDELPVMTVRTSMSTGSLAGKFDIGFGAATFDGETWFVLVTNTPSNPEVLAGAPNTGETRQFLSQLLRHGEYRIAVSYNEVVGESEDREWFRMSHVGTVDGDAFDYVEHKTISATYREKLEEVQDVLARSAAEPVL